MHQLRHLCQRVAQSRRIFGGCHLATEPGGESFKIPEWGKRGTQGFKDRRAIHQLAHRLVPLHDRGQREQRAAQPAPQQSPAHRSQGLIEHVQQRLTTVIRIGWLKQLQAALYYWSQEHGCAGLLPLGKGDMRQSGLQVPLQESEHQGYSNRRRRRIQLQSPKRVEPKERLDAPHAVVIPALPVVEARDDHAWPSLAICRQEGRRRQALGRNNLTSSGAFECVGKGFITLFPELKQAGGRF